MNKRFQVFVSSTFLDLREERHEVIQALLELDGIPAGMELWPSTSDDSWTLISRMIKESDYYLIVVGGKYGSTDAEGISYTEREYDYAVEVGKPVMAFIHGNEGAIVTARAELDASRRESLEKFKAKLRASRFCRPWSSPSELGGLVSRAFAQIKNTHPTPGWIHASESVSPGVVVELAQAQERVRVLEADLRVAKHSAPSDAAGLAHGTDSTVVRYSLFDLDEGEPISAKLSLTWDQLFVLVGPTMLEPHREDLLILRMRDQVCRLAARRRGIDKYKDPHLFDEDWQRIKIQLTALGLVQRAPRPDGATSQTFWQLTPYGEGHLTGLMAERPRAKGRRARI